MSHLGPLCHYIYDLKLVPNARISVFNVETIGMGSLDAQKLLLVNSLPLAQLPDDAILFSQGSDDLVQLHRWTKFLDVDPRQSESLHGPSSTEAVRIRTYRRVPRCSNVFSRLGIQSLPVVNELVVPQHVR